MKLLLSSVLSLLLVSVSAFGASPIRAPNIFYIDGQNIELSDSLLQQFRKSWSPNPMNRNIETSLGKADRRWVLEFISIDQGARVKPNCNHLTLLGVKPNNKHIQIIKGQKMESGAFDELWSINACGHKVNYRVFNAKGTINLGIYEIPN